MARLYNKVTEQVENLSPEDAQKAFAEGSHEIPKSEPLYLRTKTGETIKISPDNIDRKSQDIQAGLASGAVSFGDDVQAAKADDVDRLTNDSFERMSTFAQGAALGAGNLLTMGGLSLAGELDKGSKAGQMKREFETRKEVDPAVALAGEIAGQVAATAPIGAVTGATQLMQGGKAGFAGMLEGSAFGLSEGVKQLTDKDIENPERVGQILAASVGLNAVLGGVVGKVVQKAPEILAKTKASATKGLQSLWKRKVGTEMGDGLAEVIESGMSIEKRLSGLGPAARKARNNVLVESKKVGEYGTKLRTALDQIEEAKQAVSTAMQGQAKKSAFAKLLPEGIDDTARANARVYAESYKQLAESYMASAESSGIGKASLRKIGKEADEILGQIDNASAVDSYAMIDSLKRRVGLWKKKVELKAPAFGDDLDDLYSGIRQHLEDSSIYGKAADAQKEVNLAWSDLITNDRNFNRMFMSKSGVKDGWNESMTGDPGKIQSFLDNLGVFRKELHEEVFERQLSLVDDFAGRVNKYVELSPESAQKLKEAQKAINETKGFYKQAKEVMSDYNQYIEWSKRNQSLLGDSSLLGGVVAGSVAGGPMGGVLGGAAGLAARTVLDPAKRIKTLHTLDNIIPTFREASRKALSTTSKIPTAIPKPSKASVGAALRSSFNETVKKLRSVSTDPVKLAESISYQVGDTNQAAPDIALSAQTSTSRAIAYLHSVMPRGVLHTSLLDNDDSPIVPDTEMQKFMNIFEAVNSPTSIIQSFRKGELSREAVQAVKHVYPEVYSVFVEEAIDHYSNKKLNYQEQIQLGVLIDQPVNRTLTTEYITRTQTIFSDQSGLEPSAGEGGPVMSNMIDPGAGSNLDQYKRQ